MPPTQPPLCGPFGHHASPRGPKAPEVILLLENVALGNPPAPPVLPWHTHTTSTASEARRPCQASRCWLYCRLPSKGLLKGKNQRASFTVRQPGHGLLGKDVKAPGAPRGPGPQKPGEASRARALAGTKGATSLGGPAAPAGRARQTRRPFGGKPRECPEKGRAAGTGSTSWLEAKATPSGAARAAPRRPGPGTYMVTRRGFRPTGPTAFPAEPRRGGKVPLTGSLLRLPGACTVHSGTSFEQGLDDVIFRARGGRAARFGTGPPQRPQRGIIYSPAKGTSPRGA